MGCDIHSFAEKKEGGSWVSLDVEAFHRRSYGYFGWLAGVRNYSEMSPIASLRGVPDDASKAVTDQHSNMCGDAHSESWISLPELLGVDYEQIVEDRRCTVQTGERSWNGAATCAPGLGDKVVLREFLGSSFFEALDRLKQAGAERVIFWFDN